MVCKYFVDDTKCNYNKSIWIEKNNKKKIEDDEDEEEIEFRSTFKPTVLCLSY